MLNYVTSINGSFVWNKTCSWPFMYYYHFTTYGHYTASHHRFIVDSSHGELVAFDEFTFHFHCAALNEGRSSQEKAVCPFFFFSVCPSVKRVQCDKTEERSVQIFIPYERAFSLVFWEEEWLVGATTSTRNFGSTGPRWSEIAHCQPVFACSASAVTPSKKFN